MKKSLWILGCAALVFTMTFLGFRFQGVFYSYDYQLKISKKEVVEWCKRNKVDPSQVEGPNVLEANGKAAHFEWIVPAGKEVPRPIIVGVWVNLDGSTELYSGER